MMYSLLLLSSLAVLAPVLAAPGVQNSFPTATPAPAPATVPTTPKTNTVSYLTPTPTPTVLSLPPNIEELKRRIPAVSLDKRLSSCAYGTFACSDGSGCCNTGEICYGAGYCYDPYGSMDAQISSLLAEYTGITDYSSALDFFLTMTNNPAGAASSTISAHQASNSNSNSNNNNINVDSSTDPLVGLDNNGSAKKKKSKTGLIVGIVVAIVFLAVVVTVAIFLFRRSKQRRDAAAAAVQQPFVSQNPQPLIDTKIPGPYPPTPGPYPPGQYPPTPGPYPPGQYPPTSGQYPPGQYPPTPGPYPPTPVPYDPYGGAGDQDKVPYYNNQPLPPNTVEMPTNQGTGVPAQHYQPPALPAAGIVEASGESAYRPPSTAGHLPGHPPPNQGGVVYEMDSRHYGQQ